MLAVLRQRNFALVWVAGLISLTGDWLLMVALPLFVYDLTGSTAATAATAATRVLPNLLVGPVAGVFVDRWDRRRTMVTFNLLLGLSLLPLLVVRSIDWLWLLYLVSLTQSSLARFVSPAENALLPRLVTEEELVPANALNSLNNNIARLVGPPLGGIIVAAWGLSAAMLLDVASFLVAAALVALVTVDGRAVRSDSPAAASDQRSPTWTGAWAKVWHEWLAGLALVRRDRVVAIIFLYWAIAGLGEGFLRALFVPFVTTILGGDGFDYGAILAAQAVGGLVGSAAIGRFGTRLSPQRLFGLGAIGLGVIDFCIFNAHRIYPGILPPIVLMVIVGLPVACIGVGYTTLVQSVVPDEYRGRVFTSLTAEIALGLLISTALAGALGDRIGIVPLLTIEAIAFALAGLLILLTLAPDTVKLPEPAQAKLPAGD
jgi:MFS family permease